MKTIALSVMLFGVFISQSLLAATFNGEIEGFVIYGGTGKSLLFISPKTTAENVKEIPDHSTCTSMTKRFVLDIGTDYGKSVYSLLLSSFHTKAPVRLKGTGACGLYSNSEDLSYVCTAEGPC